MSDRTVLLYIAAFIFVTGIKSAFPDKNMEIRQKALEIIKSEADYAALAETMGRSFSGGNFRAELIEAIKNTGEPAVPALSECEEERETNIREIILNE